MSIENFMALTIVGAGISLIVQMIKSKLPNKNHRTAVAILFCLAAGTGYWFLSNSPYYETVLQILMGCGAVYAFILKPLEDNEKGETV